MICCFKGRFKVTSPRGYRTDPITGRQGSFHKGIDLVGVDDITVYSISDGVAKTAYQANGAGCYVVVTMADGRRVYYMHLKKGSFKVKNGEKVVAGQALGIMGATGATTGAHCHLELRPKGTTYDSLDIIEFTGIPNKNGTYLYTAEMTGYEAACIVESVCGLEKKTINWLWTYEFAEDLFKKIAVKLKR